MPQERHWSRHRVEIERKKRVDVESTYPFGSSVMIFWAFAKAWDLPALLG